MIIPTHLRPLCSFLVHMDPFILFFLTHKAVHLSNQDGN